LKIENLERKSKLGDFMGLQGNQKNQFSRKIPPLIAHANSA